VIWQIEVGGRLRSVELRDGVVIVDGQQIDVDVAAHDEGFSILVRPGDAGPGQAWGRSYDAAVVDLGSGELRVHVNGRACAARVLADGDRVMRAASGAPTRTVTNNGPQKVVAPMPGRIAKVLVKVGDSVVPRQGLVVVEAMKMENELRSSRAGTVVDVRAVEGARVESNTLLVVVE
jgi:biotin carboxyl carrier protein